MKETILVTGALGFVGNAVANYFKQNGYNVIGIGHGGLTKKELKLSSLDFWLESSITVDSLKKINQTYDVIFHGAGNGSVEFSYENPMLDFERTVTSTLNLLEYMRLSKSKATLIYPSSAAVYGSKKDIAIKESDSLNPISPYGYSNKIVEDLIESYTKSFFLNSKIIRFFSIYGAGLRKQLLWDACKKFSAENKTVIFNGTGQETRDWITVEDAAKLVYLLSSKGEGFSVFNGGSGNKITNKVMLNILKESIGFEGNIIFSGKVREGDPLFYQADVKKLRSELTDLSFTPLSEGVNHYVNWISGINHD